MFQLKDSCFYRILWFYVIREATSNNPIIIIIFTSTKGSLPSDDLERTASVIFVGELTGEQVLCGLCCVDEWLQWGHGLSLSPVPPPPQGKLRGGAIVSPLSRHLVSKFTPCAEGGGDLLASPLLCGSSNNSSNLQGLALEILSYSELKMLFCMFRSTEFISQYR